MERSAVSLICLPIKTLAADWTPVNSWGSAGGGKTSALQKFIHELLTFSVHFSPVFSPIRLNMPGER
jgi:hypothetical protein